MKFFKKLVQYITIGAGTAGLVLFGAHKYKNYYKTIEDFKKLIVKVNYVTANHCFVADTGEPGPVRDCVAKDMNENCDVAFYGGDNFYPNGLQSKAQYKKDFSKVWPDIEKYLAGGNHDSLDPDANDLLKQLCKNDKKCFYPHEFYSIQYLNRCYVVIDSSVYSVRVGRSPLEETQENFVDFAVKECGERQKYLILHHPIYSSGAGHGDSSNHRRIAFYENHVKGVFNVVMAGHDHVLSTERCEGITCHYVVGSGSKLNKCARGDNQNCFAIPGYIYDNNGILELKKLPKCALKK